MNMPVFDRAFEDQESWIEVTEIRQARHGHDSGSHTWGVRTVRVPSYWASAFHAAHKTTTQRALAVGQLGLD